MVHVSDALDLAILECLARDGRTPYTTVAAEVGTSEATVRARVAKLEASGVMSFVALCNPLLLGHISTRFLVHTSGMTPQAVARAISQLPMAGIVVLTAGRYDVFVEAMCKDFSKLVELLDDIRRIPGVSGLQSLILAEIVKDYSWTGLAGGSLGRAAGAD